MGDVMTLRELCKECGIHVSKLTQIDCIARLKSTVQSVAEIDKLFFKVWQASGGTHCHMSTWYCLCSKKFVKG